MRPVAGLCRNQNKFHQYGLRAIVLACPVRAERFLMVVSVNGFSA